MYRVLLLGGTGAIGGYVASEALSLGFEVTATTRNRSRKSNDNINYLYGNARNYEWLSSILKRNFDCIVDFMVYRTNEFKERIDDLLNATGHYVFLSSYRVFGDSRGEPLSESSPKLLDVSEDLNYLKTDEYALAKARQENMLRMHVNNNWSIVRPSVSYSSGRFQFGALEANVILPRSFLGLAVPIPHQMLDKCTSMTWAGDVGRMIAKLIGLNKAFREDFNLSTNERNTWRDVAAVYHKELGMECKPISVSEYLSLGINKYQVSYDRMFDRACDNSKILRFIEESAVNIAPLKEGLQRELISCDSCLYASTTRIHGRIDKIVGIKRFKQAKNEGALINYLSGYIPVLNNFAIAKRSKRSAPIYML